LFKNIFSSLLILGCIVLLFFAALDTLNKKYIVSQVYSKKRKYKQEVQEGSLEEITTAQLQNKEQPCNEENIRQPQNFIRGEKYLGISIRSVARAKSNGDLDGTYKKIGGTYIYDKEKLLRLVKPKDIK
jgi:hypothetical protein